MHLNSGYCHFLFCFECHSKHSNILPTLFCISANHANLRIGFEAMGKKYMVRADIQLKMKLCMWCVSVCQHLCLEVKTKYSGKSHRWFKELTVTSIWMSLLFIVVQRIQRTKPACMSVKDWSRCSKHLLKLSKTEHSLTWHVKYTIDQITAENYMKVVCL